MKGLITTSLFFYGIVGAFVSGVYIKPPNTNIRKFMGNSGFNGGGKIKLPKYLSDPENDLYKITASQASTITKEWIFTMMHNMPDANKGFGVDSTPIKYRTDAHSYLLDGINKFEQYISDHRNGPDLYLAWRPRPVKGKVRETLFVIGTEIVVKDRLFNINTIVQSPYWNGSGDIDTIELKKALDYVNKQTELTTINYEPLKKRDIRYYWSWFSQTIEDKNINGTETIESNITYINDTIDKEEKEKGEKRKRFDKKLDIEYYIDDDNTDDNVS